MCALANIHMTCPGIMIVHRMILWLKLFLSLLRDESQWKGEIQLKSIISLLYTPPLALMESLLYN